VAADPVKADIAYDVPAVVAAMDFINIMDYDYHGAWDNFTGHSTPLYGRKEEESVDSPGYMFNVNDSISWYLSHGTPPAKINLGLATYGRGWTLPAGSTETGLYCPAAGGIPMGPYTRQDGTWSYYEVLQVWFGTHRANLSI
jgi:chitinase